MKNLKDILENKLSNNKITERLHITKNSKVSELKDVSNIKIDWHVDAYFNAYTPSEKDKCFEKMKSYYNKGSKPLTLVHTIKNDIKLVNRWFAAVLLQWDEAIKVFKEAMIERIKNIDEDQLDAYIYKCFKDGGPNKTAYEHYLEIYNIKY